MDLYKTWILHRKSISRRSARSGSLSYEESKMDFEELKKKAHSLPYKTWRVYYDE